MVGKWRSYREKIGPWVQCEAVAKKTVRVLQGVSIVGCCIEMDHHAIGAKFLDFADYGLHRASLPNNVNGQKQNGEQGHAQTEAITPNP